MKRILLSTAAVLAAALAAQPAIAADIARRPPPPAQGPVVAPPPPIFNWSGFYGGVSGGYAWGDSEWTDDLGSSGKFDTSGWLAGGTLGINHQIGQTVVGLEGDISWTNIEGTGCAGTCETEIGWLGTARARLGYAADRFMPYITGGAAFGDVEASVPGLGSKSDTKIGWTAGAGAEYAFAPNWSLKAEYLYVDLGELECGTACGGVGPTEADFTSHIVRGGVNVRF